MEEHKCSLPNVSSWLYSEGDSEWVCSKCGTRWGPAYGFGPGDMTGWVQIKEEDD